MSEDKELDTHGSKTEERRPNALAFSLKTSAVKGSSIFNFPNGDIYIGSYGITEHEDVFRAGRGMYICSDKTVFRGDWEDNNLVFGKVKFPNGDEYYGNLHFNEFHGSGKYTIPGVGSVLCSFYKNSPTGMVSLVDINGFTWRGEATRDSAILHPVNQFVEAPVFTEDMVVMKTEEGVVPATMNQLDRISSKLSGVQLTPGKMSKGPSIVKPILKSAESI